VVSALVIDAQTYENSRNLDDFAGDFGMNPRSLDTKKIYKACEKTSARMHRFFGSELPALYEAARDY